MKYVSGFANMEAVIIPVKAQAEGPGGLLPFHLSPFAFCLRLCRI